ncbi:MAG: transporter substrate-binding domain-containing protein [Bacillota bacterium]
MLGRRILAALAVLAIFALTPAPALAAAGPTLPARLRVGGDNHFPPFEFVDERGVYRGFNVDIMQAISLELGIELELVPMLWSDVPSALLYGQIDAIQGMKHSPERALLYSFSDPYLVSSQAIFVRATDRHIVSLDDLAGYHVAVQRGDWAHELLRDRNDLTLVVAENQEEGMALLVEGGVHAFVGNRLSGLYVLQKRRHTDLVKIVGEPLVPANYCSVFRHSDPHLVEAFNRALKAIKRNGTYDKIYRKWFGEVVGPSAAQIRQVAYGLAGTVLFVMAVLGFTVRWNRTLRAEVRRRTAALEASDRLKERILDSVVTGIIAIDNAGRVTAANRRALDLLDLRGGPADWVGRPQVDLGLERFGAGETTVSAGGRSLAVTCQAYPLRGDDGESEGLLVALRDVTAERVAQARLIREDKMESLGRLVAGICHEVRNPLFAIKTFVELVPAKLHLPAFREELLKHVPAEVDHLSGLLGELLEYAKPRAAQPGACKVKEAVEGVIALCQGRMQEQSIERDIRIPEGLAVWVDRQQFRQILINLMLNAVEAMGAGGILSIEAAAAGGWASLSVQDTGCGIPEADLPMVFEPFYTRKADGTGLGLYICYQLTQENGGAIEVDSRPGAGTTVTLRFRLAGEGGPCPTC